MSLDEFEIKQSLAHKIHNESFWSKEEERRRDLERRNAASLRRKLNDRRQQALAVEHERRQEQRRRAERRSFTDRRVTSDWSQQRLDEEKEKLRSKKDSETAFMILTISFFIILAIFVYLLFSQMDS